MHPTWPMSKPNEIQMTDRTSNLKQTSEPQVGAVGRRLNSADASGNQKFQAFDWLATPIAVLESNGTVVFVNSELEDVIGQSRRSLEGQSFLNYFADSQPLVHALTGARSQ
jgi:hypothetical protein